jgi:hypothetical protein
MRALLSVLSFSFVVAAGCGVESQSSEETPLEDVAATGTSDEICPFFCTPQGVPCELPNGSCQNACNACLCTARGGTVVRSCSVASATAAHEGDGQ